MLVVELFDHVARCLTFVRQHHDHAECFVAVVHLKVLTALVGRIAEGAFLRHHVDFLCSTVRFAERRPFRIALFELSHPDAFEINGINQIHKSISRNIVQYLGDFVVRFLGAPAVNGREGGGR